MGSLTNRSITSRQRRGFMEKVILIQQTVKQFLYRRRFLNTFEEKSIIEGTLGNTQYIIENVNDSKDNSNTSLYFGTEGNHKNDVNVTNGDTTSINYSSHFVSSLENIKQIKQKFINGK